MKRLIIKINVVAAIIVWASAVIFAGCANNGGGSSDLQAKPESLQNELKKIMDEKALPQSLKIEHTELHHQLEMASKLPGQTGVYAKEVAYLLHPHFIKEEKFAMPPLALLPELARGNVMSEMNDYIPLCDSLKKDWSIMLKEHQQIKEKLDLLGNAAATEKQEVVVKFVESLKLHANTEEEILYPTAILVGEYLKNKLTNK